jgi:TRAP-type C4-dicarboxylate transport system permease small subunit
MTVIAKLDEAVKAGKIRLLFDLTRNCLLCALVLAVGSYTVSTSTEAFLGIVPGGWVGAALVVLGIVLALLALYEGLYHLRQEKHPAAWGVVFAVIYLVVSVRVIQLTWAFRVVG